MENFSRTVTAQDVAAMAQEIVKTKMASNDVSIHFQGSKQPSEWHSIVRQYNEQNPEFGATIRNIADVAKRNPMTIHGNGVTPKTVQWEEIFDELYCTAEINIYNEISCCPKKTLLATNQRVGTEELLATLGSFDRTRMALSDYEMHHGLGSAPKELHEEVGIVKKHFESNKTRFLNQNPEFEKVILDFVFPTIKHPKLNETGGMRSMFVQFAEETHDLLYQKEVYKSINEQ